MDMFGKKHSDETLEKIRKSKIGVKLSDEHKDKISQAQSGKNNHQYGKTGAFTGRQHSKETREKMREARKKWWAAKKVTGD